MQPSFLPSFLLLLLGLLPFHPLQAQWELFYDGTVPVTRNGSSLDLAWAGGLNFVQTSAVDLNGDGLEDLFLFDRSGNSFVTLINDGTGGTSAYHVSRAYDTIWPFPELKGWVLFRDYDCDGLADIFSYSQAGFAVYRNTSQDGTPSFELIDGQVRSNYVTTSGAPVVANLFVSQEDIPGIVDVDGDGDLDVLTFSLLGTFVELHKNLSTELYGTCDSLVFEVRNRCWGFFSENFSTNAVTLNDPCQFNVPNPEIGPDGQWPPEVVNGRAHAGSAITPLDLNGDGLMDLLLGDIGFNNIVALTNGGTVDQAMMVSADSQFPSYDVPVDLALFPGCHYVDVNGDGLRDLVVSPNAQSLSENARSMWYYRNNGTDAAPVFALQQPDLFQDRMIDLGEGAYPVPFDHDGDGLMDLIVSNAGLYQPSGPYLARMALLRNTGTATEPAFEVLTDDYMGISSLGIGQALHPAFGDLDGDGDQDLLVGDLQGRLHFFRNLASGTTAQFQLEQANISDDSGNPLDVGQYATPQLVDLDGDGLLDLIIGERNGNLNHYRNTGTPAAPVWTLVTEELGGVNTTEFWNITGHSVPFLFANEQGEREIVLGSESGWLYHYAGIEGNLDGSWTLLDSTFLGVREGMRTGVCVHDLTGDGIPDLVIGNYRGGLSFWRSDEASGVGIREGYAGAAFHMLPNPAAEQVQVWTDEPLPRGSQWVLRNALGQEVLRQRAQGDRTVVSLAGVPEGLYLVSLEGTAVTHTQRLVVARGGR